MGFFGIPIALSISSFVLIFFLIKEHKKKDFFNFSKIQIRELLKYLFLSLIIYIVSNEINSTNYIKEAGLVFAVSISGIVSVLIFSFFIFIFDRNLYNQIIKVISNKFS